MMIDIESWTMKELAELESLSGLSLQAIGEDDSPKARLMIAMTYIAKRREDPSFKYAQAERMTLDEISAFLGMDLTEDPEDAEETGDEDPKE